MGRGKLTVVPQVPPGSPVLSGRNTRLGDGYVNVSADHDGKTYTTELSTALEVNLTIGRTTPRGAEVGSVTLDGQPVTAYLARETDRGKEVVVGVSAPGEHTLEVKG